LEKALALAAQSQPRLDGTILVYIVGEQRIKKLNQEFRNKKSATDVLSFPAYTKKFFPVPMQEKIVGELFLCPLHIRKQAQRYGVTFKNELVRMLIHGFLHLAGYDHVVEKEASSMFSLQERLVEKVYHTIFKERIVPYPIDLLRKRHGIYLI
jgi:probable rRNA maturation factor